MQRATNTRIEYVVPRLACAFLALRKAGFLARARFTCCRSCAGGKLAEIVQQMGPEKAAKVQGGVFYHQQDAQVLRPKMMYMYSSLPIRYGQVHVWDGKETRAYGLPDVEIGTTVVRVLREQGLEVEWSGNPTQVIQVHGLTDDVVDAADTAQRLGGGLEDVLKIKNPNRRASGK